jgi:hypothetical protein
LYDDFDTSTGPSFAAEFFGGTAGGMGNAPYNSFLGNDRCFGSDRLSTKKAKVNSCNPTEPEVHNFTHKNSMNTFELSSWFVSNPATVDAYELQREVLCAQTAHIYLKNRESYYGTPVVRRISEIRVKGESQSPSACNASTTTSSVVSQLQSLMPPRCMSPGGKALISDGTSWICECVKNSTHVYSGASCESLLLPMLFEYLPSNVVALSTTYSVVSTYSSSSTDIGNAELSFGGCMELADSAFVATCTGDDVFITSYLDVIRTPKIDLRTDWTLEIFVQFTGRKQGQWLFGHGASANYGGLHIGVARTRNIGRGLVFGFHANDLEYNDWNPTIKTQDNNATYHLVFTYEHDFSSTQGYKKIYIDGVYKKGGAGGKYQYDGSDTRLLIGREYGPDKYYASGFSGNILYARGYPKVLSSTEIYNAWQAAAGSSFVTFNGKNLYQDSEGWILLLAYNHKAGENNALVSNTAPSSPTEGYSHVWLEDLGLSASDVDSVRFYCKTSAHSRVMHFSSSTEFVKNAIIGGSCVGNQASYWNSGTTKFDDHTANLPDATNTVYYTTLLEFPFYKTGNYHWGIGAAYNSYQRWECDDQNLNADRTEMENPDTLHQIWFKRKLS